MYFLPIEQILIEEKRQREHFDAEALAELANDIAENGLYHPITVRQEGNMIFLVAGERRLRAFKSLYQLNQTVLFGVKEGDETLKRVPIPFGMVAVNNLGQVPRLQARRIELHENIKRQNLTWRETVDADAEIIELEAAQAKAEDRAERSLTSLAAEYGKSTATLTESQVLKPYLNDPDVKKAETKKAALKIVERKRREEYDAKVISEMQRKPFSENNKLLVGAFEEQLLQVTELFDCVIVDPPYYVGASSMGDQVNEHERLYDDSPEAFEKDMTLLADLTYGKTKEQAHAFIFCSIERYHELSVIFTLSGWETWARPLIWDKVNMGALPRPEFGPRYCYECILFAIKGGKKVYKNGSDVISIPGVTSRLHPDEKPVALYVELLSRVTRAGNAILDTHCGSGPVFAAANRLSLRATGIEKNTSYAGIAIKRLESKE